MRTYFRIISFGKPFLSLGLLAIFFLILFNLLSAVSLVSVIPFLEILFSDVSIAKPEMPMDFFSSSSWKAHGYYELGLLVSEYSKLTVLVFFCIGLSIAILLKNAARYLSTWCFAPVESGIIREIRDRLFAHLTTLGMPFFTKSKKGEIIGITVSDAQVVQESVIGTLQSVLREPLAMITLLLVMLLISWKLTLFSLLILPVTAFFLNLITRTLKRKATKGQQKLGEIIAVIDEFLSGIRVVKAFQKEAFEASRFKKRNEEFTGTQISILRRTSLASPVTEVLSILIVCGIILYGGSLILNEDPELKASEFIGFIAVFSQFLAPVKTLSNAISKIQKGIAAQERIDALLNLQPDVTEASDALAFPEFRKEIRFERVSFRYEPGRDVLKDISFSIAKGQTIALVGPSGGGKSTLVDLISRFYDPVSGLISLDGTDIRKLSLHDLRKKIGYVSQEGVLFHDTVLNNIAYGHPDPDPEKVAEAARIAHADEFIRELPEGYQTLIGERGTRLSGGQRQRIALARAIFRNPPILILDEATSNLDAESERLVQDAIEKLTQNRTSIVIAHRLSTVLNADHIYVLADGEIVESGTHASLSTQNGMYQKLYSLQFQE